jgi:hypothetical protein
LFPNLSTVLAECWGITRGGTFVAVELQTWWLIVFLMYKMSLQTSGNIDRLSSWVLSFAICRRDRGFPEGGQ